MRALVLMSLVLSTAAFAIDKKPKLDLGLKIDTGNIPKGENLAKPKEKKTTTESSATPTDVSWNVVKVQHGKNFMRGPQGAVASAAYTVAGGGNPFTTERFTTVVRVKCAAKQSAPIELQVLDSRGNAMMEGNGTVYFRGEKSDESDYTLDWDPTPLRGPGTYSLMVKIAGNVIGQYPFDVVDKNAPKTGADAGK
jgi:hypothetical protein